MEFRRRSTHFTSVFLELIYTLLILGALQGLLLALFLATRHTNHTANELLAAAMLATGDDALAMRLEAWREKQTGSVAEAPEG